MDKPTIKQWYGGKKFDLSPEQVAEIDEAVSNAKRNESAEQVALDYLTANGIEPVLDPNPEPEKKKTRRPKNEN